MATDLFPMLVQKTLGQVQPQKSGIGGDMATYAKLIPMLKDLDLASLFGSSGIDTSSMFTGANNATNFLQPGQVSGLPNWLSSFGGFGGTG